MTWPGQGAPRGVGDGPGDDDRPAPAALLEQGLQREDGGLGVERVEDGLDDEQVGAAVDQAPGLLGVGLDQLVERDVALARVVDVGGDGRRAVRGAQCPGDVAGAIWRLRAHRVALGAGQPGGRDVELVGQLLHAVVGQRDALGVERVGLDDVGPGLQVATVDARR